MSGLGPAKWVTRWTVKEISQYGSVLLATFRSFGWVLCCIRSLFLLSGSVRVRIGGLVGFPSGAALGVFPAVVHGESVSCPRIARHEYPCATC